MFQNEPGVAVFCYLKPNNRKYLTLRIPESVAKRIYKRECLLLRTQGNWQACSSSLSSACSAG
jgi:hypothetical protein